jgi:hypothetical protein
MQFSNELKIQISEFLLALFLLLSLMSEYCDSMINQNRNLVISMEQVVLSYQNQLNGSFLKAYDYKFDRVLNISVLPVKNSSYLSPNDTFRSLNEDFKNGKIPSSAFEERASDYFTSLYNELNDRIRNISVNINNIQNAEVIYELRLRRLNFFKYLIIIVVLILQSLLIRSLTKYKTVELSSPIQAKRGLILQGKIKIDKKILPYVIAILFILAIIIFAIFSSHKNEIINAGIFITTVILALVGYIQLEALRVQSKADFLFRFENNFFQDDIAQEMMVVIDENESLLKKNGGKFTGYDLDNYIGYFESLGRYEKDGIIDFEFIDDIFGHYISQAWENKEIRDYVDWLRKDMKDPRYYEFFQELARRVIEKKKNLGT